MLHWTNCTSKGCDRRFLVKKINKRNLCRACNKKIITSYNEINEQMKMNILNELSSTENSITIKLPIYHTKRTGKIIPLSMNTVGAMAGSFSKRASYIYSSYKKQYEAKFIDILAHNIPNPETYINYTIQSITWRFFPKRILDLDNIWFFLQKCLGDAMVNIGMIKDDNIIYLKKHIIQFESFDIHRIGKVYVTINYE